MATLYIQEWDVEGTLPFPIDMLRYDACYPATETDSYIVKRGQDDGQRGRVCVKVARYRRSDYGLEPTAARWRSFGWAVVPGSLTARKV